MPTLRIMSVYRQRRRKHAPDLARARDELARFQAALVVRFGEDGAAAVRMRANWTEEMIFGRSDVPELPEGGDHARKTLRGLRRKVRAVLREIRTPDCWFREPALPIPVLETLGMSWDEVRKRCSDDGWLPVGSVLWLLDAIRTVRQAMPSEEQMYQWIGEMHDDARAPWCWRRVLRRRRERLVRLLGKAAELGEEVRCRFS